MSVIINYPSAVYLPIVPCQTVYLCLCPGWESKTVSGYRFIPAVVNNDVRLLGPTMPYVPYLPDPYGSDKVQYSFTVDVDTYISVDPGTDLPYVLLCSDICEVFPFGCIMDAIIEAFGEPIIG